MNHFRTEIFRFILRLISDLIFFASLSLVLTKDEFTRPDRVNVIRVREEEVKVLSEETCKIEF